MAFAAAAPGAALLKAKQEAEKQGYIFIRNRDEIVEQAKREGQAAGVERGRSGGNKSDYRGF